MGGLSKHAPTGEQHCAAPAEACRCLKAKGHLEAGDDLHTCDPETCKGSWRGSMEDDTFEVVTFPGGYPADHPNPIALAILDLLDRMTGGPV